MQSHYVAFTAPHQAELLVEEVSADDLKVGQALVAAEYSIISSGTEGASYTDLESEAPHPGRKDRVQLPYPRRTGYGHLGRVVAVAPDVANVKIGDRVLTFSRHASVTVADVARFALPVPADADGR